MKQSLPYNILLVLAVAVTGLAVFYNLALRERFGVTVEYTYPEVAALEPAQPEPRYAEEPADDGQEESYLYDDYEDTTPDRVVLITFPLELNQATMDQLMYIPQVGTVMAQRIVQYRDHLGGYTSLEQLMEIKGVGEKTYETISAYLYLEDEPDPQPTTEDNYSEEEE